MIFAQLMAKDLPHEWEPELLTADQESTHYIAGDCSAERPVQSKKTEIMPSHSKAHEVEWAPKC